MTSTEYITTNRGVRNKIIGPIQNDLLTPDMERTRSGSTQLFRREGLDNKFTSNENADVILKHEEGHVYAELIKGKWYWVNGCCECSGEKRDWVNSYIECERHDVCSKCAIPRKENKSACWGNKEGWICGTCKEKEHVEEKAEALAIFDEDEFSEWDYEDLDLAKCPYCNFEYEESHYHFSKSEDEKEKCARCDNDFLVTAVYSASFTTKRIEDEK